MYKSEETEQLENGTTRNAQSELRNILKWGERMGVDKFAHEITTIALDTSAPYYPVTKGYPCGEMLRDTNVSAVNYMNTKQVDAGMLQAVQNEGR